MSTCTSRRRAPRARRSWQPWRSSSCWSSRRRRSPRPRSRRSRSTSCAPSSRAGRSTATSRPSSRATPSRRSRSTVQDIVELSWGNLILAEASGPVIDELGGIASGMSGSPVYVDDGGVDKLVGALSYGSDFTIGGTFMATPIQYMSAIEADYVKPPAAGTYKLAEPVQTDGGRIDSVVIARGVKAATQIDARAGQLVMAPLGLIEIGGLAAPDPRLQGARREAREADRTPGGGRERRLPGAARGAAPRRRLVDLPALLAGRRLVRLGGDGDVRQRRRRRRLRPPRLVDRPLRRRHGRRLRERHLAQPVGAVQAHRPARHQGHHRPGPQLGDRRHGRPGPPRWSR